MNDANEINDNCFPEPSISSDAKSPKRDEGDSNQQPIQIVYEEIISYRGGDKITGVARVSATQGKGEFEIRVTGNTETVKDYAKQARFLELSLTSQNKRAQTKRRKLYQLYQQELRNRWFARLKSLNSVVKNASPQQLDALEHWWQDSTRQYQTPATSELEVIARLAQTLNESTPPAIAADDFRLIEIKPLHSAEDSYLFRFTVDPEIFARDVYKPIAPGTDKNIKAEIVQQGGLPVMKLSFFDEKNHKEISKTGNPLWENTNNELSLTISANVYPVTYTLTVEVSNHWRLDPD